ncbi:MAG: hypothetical protein NC307_08995, partial [Roseburia sp.]|nr:hypothetical protein [Roseburia sp.]
QIWRAKISNICLISRHYLENSSDNYLLDINILKESLGITGTLKFLEQFDHGGSGDYTKEKYENQEPEPTDEEIRQMFGY